MFYINGVAVGSLISKNEEGGNNIATPQIPGNVLSAPYMTGRKNTSLTLEFMIDYYAGQTYEKSMRYIADLMANGDGVYYLFDDATPIVEDKYYAWMVIDGRSGNISKDKGIEAATISITGVVTEDHQDSSYRPVQ